MRTRLQIKPFVVIVLAAIDEAGKTQEWMFVADEAHGCSLDNNVFEHDALALGKR